MIHADANSLSALCNQLPKQYNTARVLRSCSAFQQRAMPSMLPLYLYISFKSPPWWTKAQLQPGAWCAGDPFHADNRMGLTGTLHRISAIRDRDGSVIGLTYRIGRHVAGTPAPLHLEPVPVCWTQTIYDNIAEAG